MATNTYQDMSYLQTDTYGGDALTVSVPQLKLLQQLSPQCGPDSTVEGAKAGMFYNSGSNTVAETVDVIVLRFERLYLDWKLNRGGLAGIYKPEEIANIAPQGELKESYHYLLLVGTDVLLYYASGSAIREARAWNGLIRSVKLPGSNTFAAMYHTVWQLSSSLQKNDKGSWYIPKFTFQRFITPEEMTTVLKLRAQHCVEALPTQQAIESEF